MACEYNPSYDCNSGYDSLKGVCCDVESERIKTVLIWVIIFLSICCLAASCAVCHVRRVKQEERDRAALRNRANCNQYNVDL